MRCEEYLIPFPVRQQSKLHKAIHQTPFFLRFEQDDNCYYFGTEDDEDRVSLIVIEEGQPSLHIQLAMDDEDTALPSQVFYSLMQTILPMCGDSLELNAL